MVDVLFTPRVRKGDGLLIDQFPGHMPLHAKPHPDAHRIIAAEDSKQVPCNCHVAERIRARGRKAVCFECNDTKRQEIVNAVIDGKRLWTFQIRHKLATRGDRDNA